MAKVHKPVFAQDPKTFGEVLTAAGSASGADAIELYEAGPEGCLITRLSVTPLGTVTATGVTIYVQTAGTTAKIPRFSLSLPAYTLEATARLPLLIVEEISESTPLRLGRGDKLFAATHVANAAGIAVGGEAQEFAEAE